MNTKYSIYERSMISDVLSGLRDLCSENDSKIATSVGLHRTNVSAFHSKKRLGAVTVAGINNMLKRFGLFYSRVEGFKSASGERCPLVGMQAGNNDDIERLGMLVDALSVHAKVYLCPIGNEDGDFALIWNMKSSPWCCVCLGLGPDNAAFKGLKKQNSVNDGPTVYLPEELYQTWLETAPRKSEVLSACAGLFRQIPADMLKQRIESAMPGDFGHTSLEPASSSSAPDPI